jgi:HAD superfamily hydrolase (TIGR01509 family)
MARPSILFDLDGVISDTASVHAKAWGMVFNDVLRHLHITDRAFQDAVDYHLHIDGKLRSAGIQDFLSSRSIALPPGPQDDRSLLTMHGIGNVKNALFRDLIATDGVKIFEDARRLITRLQEAGFELGIASSSKNARIVLEQSGLLHCFSAIMDGIVAEEKGVRSKPNPEFYRHAAFLLGHQPNSCIAIEDAISGIASAKQAGIRFIVGIARRSNNDALQAHGADLVLESLDNLSIELLQRAVDVVCTTPRGAQ